jgi:hypothetical protein
MGVGRQGHAVCRGSGPLSHRRLVSDAGAGCGSDPRPCGGNVAIINGVELRAREWPDYVAESFVMWLCVLPGWWRRVICTTGVRGAEAADGPRHHGGTGGEERVPGRLLRQVPGQDDGGDPQVGVGGCEGEATEEEEEDNAQVTAREAAHGSAVRSGGDCGAEDKQGVAAGP